MIILCIIIYLIIRSNRIKNEEFTRRNNIRDKLLSNNPALNKLNEYEIEKLVDKEMYEYYKYNEANKETSPILIVFVCLTILVFVSIIVSIIVYEAG